MSASAQRQRVGAELRRMRESLGLSGTQVAEELGWSQSKISRVETARFGATVWELAALLDYYGVPDDVRAELLASVAEESGVAGAWLVRAGGPRRRQGEVAESESRLIRYRKYDAMTIPGQLQSYDYTKALALAAGFPDPDDIARRRRERQKLLETEGAPQFEVLLDARTFLRHPGSREVIIGQVRYIEERAVLPSVSIRVIPTGGSASAIALSPFTIYDFRKPPGGSVVFVETQTADVYLSADEDISSYDRLFERLGRQALSPKKSMTYLRSLVQEV